MMWIDCPKISFNPNYWICSLMIYYVQYLEDFVIINLIKMKISYIINYKSNMSQTILFLAGWDGAESDPILRCTENPVSGFQISWVPAGRLSAESHCVGCIPNHYISLDCFYLFFLELWPVLQIRILSVPHHFVRSRYFVDLGTILLFNLHQSAGSGYSNTDPLIVRIQSG